MSEALPIYYQWGSGRYGKKLFESNARFCQKDGCQALTATQASLYCAHHQRVGTWDAKNRKGLATGHCLDCGADIRGGKTPEQIARIRSYRCDDCKRKRVRILNVESTYRVGKTKLEPKYRRMCSYSGCRARVRGGSVNSQYCDTHRRVVALEEQAAERDQVRRANLVVLRSCLTHLREVAVSGDLTRQEMDDIRRIGRILSELSADTRVVRKRRKEKVIAR